MRDLTYYVGTSIDGYIAGPLDEVDHFPVSEDHLRYMVDELPEVLPSHARRQLGCDDSPNRRFGDVIMGRRTYDEGARQGIADPYAHLRTTVATSSDLEAPSQITPRADPVAAIRAMKRDASDLGIWLAGGGKLAGALLKEIDELVVKVYPLVAGTGRLLVDGTFSPVEFELREQRRFDSGCVQYTYSRRG